ncbi:MAG: glycogen/starch synthase [Bacteroidales bacterium]|nr:glycogen/starch synthase [Candidatus Physcousia equi]
MKAQKILFVSQEIEPYVPNSEHTVLGRQIPQYMIEKGREVRSFMPKFGNINERRNQLHEVIRLSGMNLIIKETDHPLIIKVASISAARMQVYFIDGEDYFLKRLAVCDEDGKEYEDNADRAIFYARGVLETVKKLRWVPDVIHCQGWMASVLPALMKTAYSEEPSFRDCKVVFSLVDQPLTLPLPEDFKECINYRTCTDKVLEGIDTPWDGTSLQQLAIKYSDAVVVSSPNAPQNLIDYAKQNAPKCLDYPGEDWEAYMQFFDNL